MPLTCCESFFDGHLLQASSSNVQYVHASMLNSFYFFIFVKTVLVVEKICVELL